MLIELLAIYAQAMTIKALTERKFIRLRHFNTAIECKRLKGVAEVATCVHDYGREAPTYSVAVRFNEYYPGGGRVSISSEKLTCKAQADLLRDAIIEIAEIAARIL